MARSLYGPSCGKPKAIKATKVLQADLLKQAKTLRERPELAVPECRGDHRACPFTRVEAQLRRVASLAGDKRRLEKLSRHGDPLARAYAGTLLLTHAEGLPYLAAAVVEDTSVPFAVRGKTKREMLLGMQRFADPFLRLLSVADMAQKRGLFVFSLDDRMVCTGREPRPPPEYIPQVLKESDYVLGPVEGGHSCAHGDGEAVLTVRWPAAGTQLRVCRGCASREESLGHVLARRMVAPRSADVLEVTGKPHFECGVHGGDCPLGRESALAGDDVAAYLSGELSDFAALEKTVEQVMSEARGQTLYASGGVCYGDDLEAFAESLRGTEAERRALKAVLAADGSGWVGNGTTLRKILAARWDDHAEAALAAVADRQVAKKLVGAGGSAEPAALIRMALEEAEKGKVREALPAYDGLPPVASMADSFAKACRFKGRRAAAKVIESRGASSRVQRVVAYAFLLAIGEGTGKDWKYPRDEADLAKFLETFASVMMTATGREYHEALQNLLTACGSGETVDFPGG